MHKMLKNMDFSCYTAKRQDIITTYPIKNQA